MSALGLCDQQDHIATLILKRPPVFQGRSVGKTTPVLGRRIAGVRYSDTYQLQAACCRGGSRLYPSADMLARLVWAVT